jgi:GAF domain-containing protein
MVGAAIQQRRAHIALDTDVAERFANPLLPDTRSEIALPLIVGNQVLGALDVQSVLPSAFDEASAAVLQTMADQIAIALSNAELFKQTASTLQSTRSLFAASQAISTATNADGILSALINQIAADASRAAITLTGPLDETGQPAYFEFVATWAHADFAALTQLIRPGTRFTPQQLPGVSAVTVARPLIVSDASADDVAPALRTLMHRFSAEALIALALTADQAFLGILVIGYQHARTFDSDYLQTLITLSNQAAIVLQNRRSLADMQATLAQLDVVNRRLTGEAWRTYTAPLGGALTVQDIAPGFAEQSTPAALNAPIVVRGEPIGALKLQDGDPNRTWSATDQALLEAVASEIAVTIDNARLLEQTERRAQREARLSQIAQRLRQATDVDSILQAATEELSLALDTSHAQAQLGQGSGAIDSGNHHRDHGQA